MADPEWDDHAIHNSPIYDKDGNAIDSLDDGGVRRLRVEAKLIDDTQEDRQKIVHVDFMKDAVAATTYFMLIDLDGASYKHDLAKTFLKIASIAALARKTKSSDKWRVRIGLILAIDGTDADIGFISVGYADLRDSGRFLAEKTEVGIFPVLVDLQHAAGAYDKIAASVITDTAVNTAITLDDAFGAAVTPAVGDLVLQAELVSGSGIVDFAYNVGYFAED